MKKVLFILIGILALSKVHSQNNILVFQSDFGVKDGAVSAMKGVASSVSPDLKIYDLTHEIPAYNIWEAAYRLEQTVSFWPAGTVFVSVVDPGVGTERKSVVLKTKTGHFIVTPDNGTLTLIAESLGIAEIREIDEAVNRRKNSEGSYTFHGRDVYAYTGARLASKSISFEQVGPKLPEKVISIPYQKAVREGNTIKGNISILDIQYGNIWTNIGSTLFKELDPAFGDTFKFKIYHDHLKVFEGIIPYYQTFGGVAVGKPLCYLNSLMFLSLAINQGSFSHKYHIESGSTWSIELTKYVPKVKGQK